MVWNLLSNAVKYTPRSGKVHVNLLRVNSHVEVLVNDTGVKRFLLPNDDDLKLGELVFFR